MRWRQGRRSQNVEDRRGMRLPRGRGAAVGGLGGVGLLVVILLAVFFGVDPTQLLMDAPTSSLPSSAPMEPSGPRPGS